MEKYSVCRGRRLSVEESQLIGSGYASLVYELEDGNVVKVLKHGGQEEAKREILLAKWAFSKGVPTAISYDVVDVNGKPGLVYESLGRENLRNAFRDEPERFDEILDDYLTLLRTINGISDSEEQLPKAIDQYRSALKGAADLLTREEIEKTSALLDTIQDSQTIIHGDCQIKNVRVVNGKLFLIDLDTLSRGDPIFELAALFCCYRGYISLSGESFDSFFEIPAEMLSRILNGVLDGYYPGLPENIRSENARKVALLGWLNMVNSMHNDSPEDKAATALTVRYFREALNGLNDLQLTRSV